MAIQSGAPGTWNTASGFNRAAGMRTPEVVTPVLGGNFCAWPRTATAERRANHRAGRMLKCIITGVKSLAAVFTLVAAPVLITLAGEAAGGRALRAAVPQAPAARGQRGLSGLASDKDFFEGKIRPLLAANCYDCHTEEQLGGLRLDSRDAMLKGGKRGPAIVPGDPDRSLLIAAVRQTGDLKMPKGGHLKPDEIEALAAWVRAGAGWPAASTSSASAPSAAKTAYMIKPEQRAFWAFQPIRTPAIPAVAHTDWPRSDIDRLALARLEKEGLAPVKSADRLTLLRRATLDLTGLPPTPDEIDAFTKDTSPDAFATVVDRLLASPQYGEAWGRLWLDVARYGEDDYR